MFEERREAKRRKKFRKELKPVYGWSKKLRYRDMQKFDAVDSQLLSTHKDDPRRKIYSAVYLDAAGVTWDEYETAVRELGFDRVFVALEIYAYDMSATKIYLDERLSSIRKLVPKDHAFKVFLDGLGMNPGGTGFLLRKGHELELASDEYFDAMQLAGYHSFELLIQSGVAPKVIIEYCHKYDLDGELFLAFKLDNRI